MYGHYVLINGNYTKLKHIELRVKTDGGGREDRDTPNRFQLHVCFAGQKRKGKSRKQKQSEEFQMSKNGSIQTEICW
jgi:hypothetical protein